MVDLRTVIAGIMALSLIWSSVNMLVVFVVVMSSKSAAPSLIGEPCSRRRLRGDLESVLVAGMVGWLAGGVLMDTVVVDRC